MKLWYPLFVAALFTLLISCNKSDIPDPGSGGQDLTPGNSNSDWLIPKNDVLDAAGQDGIPSIDAPYFVTAHADQGKLHWIKDNDLILGVKIGDEIRGYPHPVLDWHEIVNDDFETASVAITYCPLTGTGIGWDRQIDGKTTTFGVSGLLYNSNLMPYDRDTDSYWSQMRLDCVHGKRIGEEAKKYQLIEIPWSLWKTWFPNAKVLSGSLFQYSRPYGTYPYDDYKTDEGTLFPVDRPDDNRLHDKERVLGILKNDAALVFRFSSFRFREINVVMSEFFGEKIIIIGSEKLNFLTAFYSKIMDGTPVASFAPIQGENEIIAKDGSGTTWNIFGEAVSGPLKGNRLMPTGAMIGYWFTWPSFYKVTQIYEN